MKRSIKIWLIIFLAVGVIFSVKTHVSLLNKYLAVEKELKESMFQLSQEQTEKQIVQDELKIMKDRFQDVLANLDNAQRELSIVNDRLSGYEESYLALQKENILLEAKLHSLKDLKDAIRLVKAEHYRQRAQEYLAKKERQKEIDAQELAQGNGGYLVRNGRSSYQQKIKIEVKAVY